MDFITQLPKTRKGYDAIMVMVDRFTKMAHFEATHSNVKTPEVANMFFRTVFQYHGLPHNIVTDRDSKFTSRFWQELFKLLDTKLILSTAFHPQTDGQMEHTNRTLEQMLRITVNYQQNDWDEQLPALEFAYNNSVNNSTKETPFFLDNGKHPNVPDNLISPKIPVNIPTVDEFLQKMQNIIKIAT